MAAKSKAALTVTEALQRLLPYKLPPALNTKRGSLFSILSRRQNDGVGSKVYQTRWTEKGIAGCYYTITRVRLKDEGRHGKAWGQLFWRGRPVGEERIRTGLKYEWDMGESEGKIVPDSELVHAPRSQVSSTREMLRLVRREALAKAAAAAAAKRKSKPRPPTQPHTPGP